MNDEEKEVSYQSLLSLKKSIGCMTVCADKKVMYQKTARKFTALSSYKDADECAEECKKLAKQTNKELKKSIYKRALNMKNTAKLASEYKLAATEFRKVSGYKDSDVMAAECEQLSDRIDRKTIWKRIINYGIVLFAIAVVIVGANTAHAKYYFANFNKMTGAYSLAAEEYRKLGNYKDSKERRIECQYQNGLHLKAKGNYSEAAKAFASAGDYKDSDDLRVAMEKNLIKMSKPGDTVKVGGCDWEIIDTNDNQVLLMKKSALPGKAYQDNAGDVTWEKSSLRQWLNTEFLEGNFSKAERNNIVLSNVINEDNSVYGTSGGNSTKDYTYLLSITEAAKYQPLFAAFKNNSWLRSPGNNQKSAAFLSVKGTVMDYGYTATSNEFTVRPVLWFRIN